MAASADVGIALALTLAAGLSTGIGSAIAYFIKRPKVVYLSFSLGPSYGHGHLVITGVVLGMLIMALSLMML